MEKEELKRNFEAIKKFFSQKKIQTIVIVLILIAILFLGSWIRLQNLPLLKDQTTGKHIPLALDPFYFLRIAETMVEQGGLPPYDPMRKPFEVGWSHEILPKVVILLHKIGKVFDNDMTLQYADVIYPVIFFILGLIAFFFLILSLTNSKTTALLSSLFLATTPTYLYRTMAGFADHEAIGMFAFFLTLLCYSLSLKFLEKEESNKKKIGKAILLGGLVGFFSAFTIASWGGIANFIFMIIPLSFGLIWLIKSQRIDKNEKENLFNLLVFYIVFFFSSIMFGLAYGFNISSIISKVMLGTSSLINGAVLLFLITDFLIIEIEERFKFLERKKVKKYRILFSGIGSALLACVLLALSGKGIIPLISSLIEGLLHPFGTGRVGLTVSENKQPYLKDWMTQIGKKLSLIHI